MNSTHEPNDKLAAIKQALFDGEKIQAIKLYRELFQGGLAEAKQGVEKLEAELRQSAPERFKAPQRTTGCLSLIVMVCVLAATLLAASWKLLVR